MVKHTQTIRWVLPDFVGLAIKELKFKNQHKFETENKYILQCVLLVLQEFGWSRIG